MRSELAARGINTTIPYTVDENGAFTVRPRALRENASSTTRAKKATPTTP